MKYFLKTGPGNKLHSNIHTKCMRLSQSLSGEISFKTWDEPKVTKIGLISKNFWLNFSVEEDAHLKLSKNHWSAFYFNVFSMLCLVELTLESPTENNS